MWYCLLRFVSGFRETIVFKDEAEAEEFRFSFYSRDKAKEDSNMIFASNNYEGLYINLDNVETITKPKEYKEDVAFQSDQ